ncbi:hypothetical protein EDC61_10215 [Sulfuritortus calidifontis]|uniref:Nickel transport protein n=1 Tax=Sulfuritortus calidifontis TaxID=1914471 RepID=A0A4R3JXM7_9PROT|nr:hypothetical protein [Sulfuritortus calidifontis]TCS73247.1 hypothetical protein EDC61_10215 [Sulfuritortus calidifontis]
MLRPTLFWLAAALATAVQAAQPTADCRRLEARAFSSLPMLVPAGRGDRGQAPYCLANLHADTVAVHAGAGSPWTVPVAQGGFAVATRKAGNYHWLQVRQETQQGIVSASTVHYFANPGPAPTAMLLGPKAELEIVPQPLPREHWRYRAGETWAFLVRFKGRPLAGAKLRLETSGGTRQVFSADGRGVVRVTFPDDIGAGQSGHGAGHHGGEPENRFVLAIGHTDAAGHDYLSAFNYKYGQADAAGKSLGAGLGFLLLGGTLGLPLVLGKRGKKHG